MAKGREINVDAGSRLDLQDAADASQSALAILMAAFERRSALVGGQAVTLDSMVEIAADAGYRGTVDQAGDILRREGRFIVDPGPDGRLVVRRADSPTP